jgi:CPA2 family monovalent cation:H+ antiporter-2
MLFDPGFVLREPWLVAGGLAVVLIFKPLSALAIVAVCGYPVRTALTVAIGLAQIGEFSFIVAQQALKSNMIPEAAMQVLVASAMVSITINPLLFRSLERFESALRRVPWLFAILNARHSRRAAGLNERARGSIAANTRPLAIIAGYGPVGRVVDAMLRDAKIETVIVDMNIDTVRSLAKAGRTAIFGDATRHEILDEAGIRHATYLIVTLPGAEGLVSLAMAARELNPAIELTVRTRYLVEGEALRSAGVSHIVFEEGEVGVALARRVLERRGTERSTMDTLLSAIRRTWGMDVEPSPRPTETPDTTDPAAGRNAAQP